MASKKRFILRTQAFQTIETTMGNESLRKMYKLISGWPHSDPDEFPRVTNFPLVLLHNKFTTFVSSIKSYKPN